MTLGALDDYLGMHVARERSLLLNTSPSFFVVFARASPT